MAMRGASLRRRLTEAEAMILVMMAPIIDLME